MFFQWFSCISDVFFRFVFFFRSRFFRLRPTRFPFSDNQVFGSGTVTYLIIGSSYLAIICYHHARYISLYIYTHIHIYIYTYTHIYIHWHRKWGIPGLLMVLPPLGTPPWLGYFEKTPHIQVWSSTLLVGEGLTCNYCPQLVGVHGFNQWPTWGFNGCHLKI